MNQTNLTAFALIVIAVTTLIVIGLVALFVPGDNAVVLAILVGFAVTASGWFLSFRQGQATHDLVNSKSEELNEAIRESAYAQGRKDQKDQSGSRDDYDGPN